MSTTQSSSDAATRTNGSGHTDLMEPAATSPGGFVDPGMPAHHERMADRDPKASRRAELQVATIFGISVLGTIGTLVAFFALPLDGSVAQVRTMNIALGVGLALSLLGIGVGAIHWAKTLMTGTEISEERHEQGSPEPVRAAAVDALAQGVADSGIRRRSVLKGGLVSALALFPLALAVPLIAEVGGDWNVSKFKHTLWGKGVRLAKDHDGVPIKAADVTIGSAFHVVPYSEDIPEDVRPGTHAWMTEKAKAVVLMVRLNPADLHEADDRKSWSYDGIVAYSKICTHVGCPVALYERQTHHILCPCHQSTFDVSDGAKVVFGPAKRPLPQLPITVDSEGYLVAQDDFNEPIGPSFWERLK